MLVGNWTLCSVACTLSVFHLCLASCVGFQCPVINSGLGSQAGAGSGGIRAWILLREQVCAVGQSLSNQQVFASICHHGLHMHVCDRPEHQ